jgi:methylenetetrahydrofolate dehydrogenase (NAD+)
VSDLANKVRRSVRAYASKQQEQTVKLVAILANGPYRADAENYSRHIEENCREDGIDYELWRVNPATPSLVEAAIRNANARPDVHGILVYYPIFKSHDSNHTKYSTQQRGPYKNQLTGVYYKTQDDYLRDVVCPSKDVEGLCHEYNARWLFRSYRNHTNNNNNEKRIIEPNQELVVFPCTALSVYRILEHELQRRRDQQSFRNNNDNDSQLVATVINRSEILGRPLAAMLANHLGATVYSVDISSILLFRPDGRLRRCPSLGLEECLEQSNIIVSAVPNPNFQLDLNKIQPGCIVVNVSEYPNVDEEALLENNVPDVLYVPHVGKMTVAILEQNLVKLHRRQRRQEKRKKEERIITA